jgi:MTH538 TIR-like domain (DUF1863)
MHTRLEEHMARKVFFSFHYQRDLWRVNVVRNSGMIEGVAAAGFADASLWEETKRHGPAAVKALIDRALDGTSVTVVLIGAETASRKYIDYEITQSLSRGSGLLGVRIHTLKDREGRTDIAGPIPLGLVAAGAPIYSWEYGNLGGWVEDAYRAAVAKRSK